MSSVVVLSREVFDAIEFDAACSGDHRAAAERMSHLADFGTQTVAMPRSEAYVRAGEQWLLADDPAAAARGFMRALEDGGPSSVDPRVPLARAFLMLGRDEEAESLIRQLGQEPARDPRMCDLMAELLVDRADLVGALAWATVGVELCLGMSPGPVNAWAERVARTDRGAGRIAGRQAGGPGSADGAEPPDDLPLEALSSDLTEFRLLLSLRFRIRNDLGLPEDAYDRLLDAPPSATSGPAGSG